MSSPAVPVDGSGQRSGPQRPAMLDTRDDGVGFGLPSPGESGTDDCTSPSSVQSSSKATTLASMLRVREMRRGSSPSSRSLTSSPSNSVGGGREPAGVPHPSPATAVARPTGVRAGRGRRHTARRASRFVLDGPVFEPRRVGGSFAEGAGALGEGEELGDGELAAATSPVAVGTVLPPGSDGTPAGRDGSSTASVGSNGTEPHRQSTSALRAGVATRGSARRGRRTTVQLMSLTRARMGSGSLASSVRRASVRGSAAHASPLTPAGGASGRAGAGGEGGWTPLGRREGGGHGRSRSWSETSDTRAGAEDKLSADGQFFLGSSLQLMEELSCRRADVNQILPILTDLLDPSKHTFSQKEEASLSKLRQWVKAKEDEHAKTQRFKDNVISGWLRKLDSHKITMRKRWVVIDGSNLMYYEDRAETRLKGVLQLAGCRCEPMSAVVEMRRNVFEVVAADRGTLNPLHAGKSVYSWVANSSAERDMWVKAIRVASGRLPPDLPAMRWHQLIRSCHTPERYRRVLGQMVGAPAFTVSADYVRLQMASSARGLAAEATTGEGVLESQRKAAVKAAEVSSERRRAGHAPGDRVSMSQLRKDIQRDSVDVDGLALRGPQAGFLLAALSKRVAAAVKGEADEHWVRPGEADTANAFESAVMEFCREVLLCSSRTVTGGDAYDATEMVFRNPDIVLICPDASGESDPVEITITDMEEEAESKADTPPSDIGRSRSASTRDSGGSGGAVKALKSSTRAMLRRLASPGEKIFNRLFKKGGGGTAGGDDDDGRDSDTSSVSSSTSLRRTASLTSGDYRDAASRPGCNVCVTVSATMGYRLISANPMSEDDATLATIEATFTRKFPWRGCPLPAEISLRVVSLGRGAAEAARMRARTTSGAGAHSATSSPASSPFHGGDSATAPRKRRASAAAAAPATGRTVAVQAAASANGSNDSNGSHGSSGEGDAEAAVPTTATTTDSQQLAEAGVDGSGDTDVPAVVSPTGVRAGATAGASPRAGAQGNGRRRATVGGRPATSEGGTRGVPPPRPPPGKPPAAALSRAAARRASTSDVLTSSRARQAAEEAAAGEATPTHGEPTG